MADQDSPLGKAGAVDTANSKAGSSAAALPTAAKTSPSTSVESDASGPAEKKTPPLEVNISLVWGGLVNVKTNVAVGARYDGLAFAGSTRAFDRALDSWLTRAVDLGIIGSALGQLFPIDLRQYHMEDRLKARTLLLAGMGEPGRFAQDSLQFLMSNVIVAIKAMGETEFAIPLLGIRRKELAIGQAVRGFIQGIDDGYERFKAIAENATLLKQGLLMLARQPLSILLVHPDADKLKQIGDELEAIKADAGRSNLALNIRTADPVAPDPEIESATADTGPDSTVTYLRITRSKPAAAPAVVPDASAVPSRRKKVPAHTTTDFFPTDVFQFSAMSELAVVPQREQRVNARLTGEIANRMAKTDPQANDPRVDDAMLLMRERQGYCFTKLMIPDDFQKLIDGPADVTLEVDETTAAYPWEMAASRKLTGAFFLGTNVAVSRQFRTLLSPPPTSPPALNNTHQRADHRRSRGRRCGAAGRAQGSSGRGRCAATGAKLLAARIQDQRNRSRRFVRRS